MATKQFTLSNLQYLIARDKLTLVPDYQRESVWTKSQKQLLMDSLLRDIDVPKLYFRKRDGGTYEVVDGQQRVRAVTEYLDSNFALDGEADPVDGLEVAGKPFADLPTELQMKLGSTSMDIVELPESYTDEQVEELFLRLQNGTSLNAPEKRRAIQGNMRTIVKSIAQNKFFAKHCAFSSKRYAYEDAVAKLLHLLLSGSITDIKHRSIGDTYEKHKGITLTHPEVKRLKKAIQFLSRAFKDLPSPKLKKFSVISLVYVVAELMEIYALSGSEKEFGQAYLDFEQRRLENDEQEDEGKQDSRLSAYTSAARGDRVQDLEYRHETLRREIVAQLVDVPLIDKTRAFTEDQRFAIFLRDKGICQGCRKPASEASFHADHKDPHSKGGRTRISNGQVLCPQCNLKKGSKKAA